MTRTALILGVLAAAVLAQEPAIETTIREHEAFLDGAPHALILEMERPGDAIELGLEFRFGLYRISAKGGIESARGGLLFEALLVLAPPPPNDAPGVL